MKLEIEVKFRIVDTGDLLRRIDTLGAKSFPRTFETNIRFEDAGKTLYPSGRLLRLRLSESAKLTFKEQPEITDEGFKVFREHEVTVSDFAEMRTMLERLGFHEAQVYEKYRTHFVIGETVLCLDELPFGAFLEIEGERDSIRSLADRLELPWESRIVTNYLSMFDIIRNRMNLSFTDVTFDNFRGVTVDIDGIMPLFTV